MPGWGLEIIVVDDGSSDTPDLIRVCALFPGIHQIHHKRNQGMCAARNSGIKKSRGDFVTLLDADDEFVTDWFDVFQSIIVEWPAQANVCFTPCVNTKGQRTCAQPNYTGWLTARDMVLEHLSGEYNPIFRGAYIRRSGYTDLGTRKSCGLLSYLRMARESPFWITNKVQRLYHDTVAQSVSQGWARADKASETCRCFLAVLETHGEFIKTVSEQKYYEMNHKILIYRMFAGEGRDLRAWWQLYSARSVKSWLATFVMLVIGPVASEHFLQLSKRFQIVRRYG